MGNMSYCKFENTLGDIEDCYESLCNEGIMSEEDSRYEAAARKGLVELCCRIAEEFGDEL